jgi:zinc transporter ZupT
MSFFFAPVLTLVGFLVAQQGALGAASGVCLGYAAGLMMRFEVQDIQRRRNHGTTHTP